MLRTFLGGKRAFLCSGGATGRVWTLILGGLLLLALAAPAGAFNIRSDQVVVPVVVHLPGHNGTQWRSDVWIQSPSSNVLEVTLSYYPESGGVLTDTVHLESYHGVFFHDIVLETFGLDNSKGMLIISADNPAVEVRARIYNTGNASGEFGQAVPGLPMDRLGRQGYLSGATTADGTRLAIGIANPTEETYTVSVDVWDSVTHNKLSSRTVDLAPHQLIQLDKVAELWNLPPRDAVFISINSTDNADTFYAYASVVRNVTGDATFIFGTTPNVGLD